MIEPDFGRRQQSVFMRAGESGLLPGHGRSSPGWHVGEEIEAVLPERPALLLRHATTARGDRAVTCDLTRYSCVIT